MRLLFQKDVDGASGDVYFMKFAGVSTEEKPIDNVATGSIFIEVDTDKKYIFDEESATWSEETPAIAPVDPVDPEVIVEAVEDWLDDHPEAVTTVADGAISYAKLDSSLKESVDDVSDLKNEISFSMDNGVTIINKDISWINAYVNNAGTIVSSTASITGLVTMNAGETVKIGTANSNITIIGSTTASSISVGDSITKIQTTTSSGNFEEYTYTANEQINLVLCVRKSDYSLIFYKYSTELKNIENRVNARIDDVQDVVLKTVPYNWYNGSTTETTYTTSTFSGYATSWSITDDVHVKSIKTALYSRDSSNISTICMRIESGSFVFEKSYSVNIGSEMTDVELPVDMVIPSGTVYVGIAANKISTFKQSATDNGHSYKYWTNGDITHLSQLKNSGGMTNRLYLVANIYEINALQAVHTNDIVDYAVTIKKTDFVNVEIGNNILDESTIKYGTFYSGESGNVTLTQSASTVGYSTICVNVEGLEKITISSNKQTAHYYDWYATSEPVTEVGETKAYSSFSGYAYVSLPQTITIPNGAKYILLSVTHINESGANVMINSGETPMDYEPYKKTIYIDGSSMQLADENKELASIKAPDSYDLVVGDTFQLFYKGIINSVHPEKYYIEAQCSSGKAFERMFEVTPTQAGTLSLEISLFDDTHNMIESKTISLVVKAKATSTSSAKNILCVGDSLTTAGTWVVELNRRLTGSGGTPAGDGLSNINFIGTRVANNVHYEGYGGWTLNSYNTAAVSTNAKIITCTHDKTEAQDQHSIYKDANNETWKLETIEQGTIKIIAVSSEGRNFPETGTLTWVSGGVNHSNIVYTASENAPGNPFWNVTENKVDFASYASDLGVSSIDYVLVLIGWNSASWSESTYKESAQTFIDNVKASFPNAKIVFMGLQIPAFDGLANNYGANGIYSKYWGLMQYVHNLDDWYADVADDNANVYSKNLSGQFDTEYNMPTDTVAVNSRNATTISKQSNGVHPATPGYYQIADAMYRAIESIL